MLLKSVYDSQDQIPEFARNVAGLYKQRNDGKWEIQHSEIEGIAELSNPGLAANRDALRAEKTTAENAKAAAEQRASDLERQLGAVRTPGSIILSSDDAKAWQGFTSLGKLTDVKKIVEEYPALKKSVEFQKTEGDLREALKDTGFNFDVVRDTLASPRGEGLKVIRKPVQEVDEETGKKVTVNRPFVVQRTKSEGENTFKEVETPLGDFASANWPQWLVTALSSNVEGNNDDGSGNEGEEGDTPRGLLPLSTGGGAQPPKGVTPPPDNSGVRLPHMGGGSTTQSGTKRGASIDIAATVKEMNAERSTRPNPLDPKRPATASQ